MNSSQKLLMEHLSIAILGIACFLIFGFSVLYLPTMLPSSLGFLAKALTVVSFIGILFVILGSWGIGPVAKRRDNASREVDRIRREKYAKAKQPWER